MAGMRAGEAPARRGADGAAVPPARSHDRPPAWHQGSPPDNRARRARHLPTRMHPGATGHGSRRRGHASAGSRRYPSVDDALQRGSREDGCRMVLDHGVGLPLARPHLVPERQVPGRGAPRGVGLGEAEAHLAHVDAELNGDAAGVAHQPFLGDLLGAGLHEAIGDRPDGEALPRRRAKSPSPRCVPRRQDAVRREQAAPGP